LRLGITTDCIHYKHADGRVGTENHILLRQFEQLGGHFPKTTIACAFGILDDSKVISWYSKDFNFIELPVVGGMRLVDKVKIFTTIPKWINGFRKINKQSDIVYQRFPNNLNIPGFFYFYFKKKKVFATFTGTWPDYPGEPLTYRFQKWFLRKLFRGPVWVYISQKGKEPRIIPGFSPSYSQQEWEEESHQVKNRIKSIYSNGLPLLRLITVGTLIYYKNQLAIIKACAVLKTKGIPFTLKIVGNGPMFQELENYIKEQNLENEIEMVGKKNYQDLRVLYRQSDFVVQAPLKEGFGKVPIEGFFHGAIPILNNLSMAGYMTGNSERGFLFENGDGLKLAERLIEIKSKISLLPAMIEKGRAFAKIQTLESWANEYYAKVSEFYKIS
jgi:glycosyltransferase involved in cell wall biosynthesis